MALKVASASKVLKEKLQPQELVHEKHLKPQQMMKLVVPLVV
jgi:hypothetical protein